MQDPTRRPAPAERALDALCLLLSDVRYGLGAYLGVYLLTQHAWDEASIGLALSIGGLVGLLSQTPIGLLVDATRAKRALLAGAVVVVTATCLVIPLAPRFWPVAAAGVVAGDAAADVRELTEAMVLRSYELQQHAWEASAEEEVLDPPVNDRLGEVSCPTLVLVGDEDVSDMVAIAAHVADSVSGARMVNLSGVAHLPSLERADEVNALLLAFLREC